MERAYGVSRKHCPIYVRLRVAYVCRMTKARVFRQVNGPSCLVWITRETCRYVRGGTLASLNGCHLLRNSGACSGRCPHVEGQSPVLPMTAYLSSGPATCSLKLEDPHTLLTAMAPPRRTAFQLARHPLVRKPCERCCERYVVHRAESGHEQVVAPHNHSAPATYPSTKPG